METIKKDDFIGYEYSEVKIRKEYSSLLIDNYQNFGWILENLETIIQPVGHVLIQFKRDRKIRNKAELTRLQRQLDSLIEQISRLEKQKSAMAMVAALAIGVIGCTFLAGSVFAISYGENIPLTILFGLPGLLGWILPYFVYGKLVDKKSQELSPLFEEKYDEIYEVSKRANALLEV